MPEVKVTHEGLAGDDAKVKPKREPVPPGIYHALIMAAPSGTTRGSPVLDKISVEFQVLYQVQEDGTRDESHAGRRVYQDYVLERTPGNDSLDEQRRYELRMLLDATGIQFSDSGFNTDHLLNKTVAITVRHRPAKQPDANGMIRVFTNVVHIDTTEEISDDDLV